MTTTNPGGRSPRAVATSEAPTDVATPNAAVAPPTGATAYQRPRRVRTTIVRVDPWTVLRLSFLLSIAVAVVTLVALFVLWGLLSAGGVFSTVEQSANDILGEGATTFTQYFEFGQVFRVGVLLALADIVLLTALATLGAFLFNLATSLTGGLEVSVIEDH
ncbi:MAG TPA: DUF3566 domain-containing protein [Actinomycetes bacterium]|nr:DUF3566 domain-containing protein [Actinomycetes bacterium]